MAAPVNLPIVSKASPVVDKTPVESAPTTGTDNSGFSQVLHHQMGKQQAQAKPASDSSKTSAKSNNSDTKQSVNQDSSTSKSAQETPKSAPEQPAQAKTGANAQQTATAQQAEKTQQPDQQQPDNVDAAMAAAMQTPAAPMLQLRELVAASMHGGNQDGNLLPQQANAGPTTASADAQAAMMKLLAQRAASTGTETAGQQSQQAEAGSSSGLPQELQLLEQRIQKQITELKNQASTPSTAASGTDSADANTPALDIKQLQGLENALQSLAKANTQADSKGLATAWDQLQNRLQQLQLPQDATSSDSQDGLTGMLKSLKQEMASLQQAVHGQGGADTKTVRLAFQEMLGKLSSQHQADKPAAQPANPNTTFANSGLSPSSTTVAQAPGQQATQVPVPTTTVNVPVHNQAWGQAMAERLKWMVNQDLKHAEIKLNPRHLGPIEVKIAMDQDQATVSFSAHHVMTKEALESAMPKLREMFGNNGINLVDVNVSHHSGSEGQQANANSQQGQPGGDKHANWSPFDTTSNEPLISDARTSQWMGSNRMLDTYV